MTASLPVLKQSRLLRFVSLCLLYASQGLPVGLFQVAIPAWFAAEGLSAGQVGGFIAIVFLPWSFKLLAGPVMDRFSFPPMGRRRPWVIGAQFGLVLTFLMMAVLSPDPADSYLLLAVMGFVCNFFGALQDVAVDGMAIDILEEDERAQGNAFMYGGQIAGISFASAFGGAALMTFGLAFAALLMSMSVFLIMLIPVFLRERPGERVLPWGRGDASPEALEAAGASWKLIFQRLIRSLVLPMSLLLVVVEGLNRVAAGVVVAISPVVSVQELGWLQSDYSSWYAVCGVIAAVIGVLVGPVVDRYGAKQALGWVIGFRVLTFLVMGLTGALWGTSKVFETFILVNYISGQIVTIAIIALFMRLCFQQVAATQFAVYMATANLTYSLGSALVGPLTAVTDYPGIFLALAGLNIACLAMLPWLDVERHEAGLEALARQDAATAAG